VALIPYFTLSWSYVYPSISRDFSVSQSETLYPFKKLLFIYLSNPKTTIIQWIMMRN
jgi:hypothetical protein